MLQRSELLCLLSNILYLLFSLTILIVLLTCDHTLPLFPLTWSRFSRLRTLQKHPFVFPTGISSVFTTFVKWYKRNGNIMLRSCKADFLVWSFSHETWNSKPEFLLAGYSPPSSNKRSIWLKLSFTVSRKYTATTLLTILPKCVEV